MKAWKNCILYLAMILAGLFYFSACSKQEDVEHEYLIRYSLLKQMTVPGMQSFIQNASQVYSALDSLPADLRYDVSVYLVNYPVNFQGKTLTASGVVCLPEAKGNFGIISFQNGTNTLHDAAPSRDIFNGLYTLIESAASYGFIVVIADYLGFGSSEQIVHPYYHRESNDLAVKNLILAARELTNEGNIQAGCNGNIFLMGYSQGGWATLSAGRYFEETAPSGMSAKAVSCGAGAYQLIPFSEHVLSLVTYPTPYYLPYFIESHRQNGMLTDPLSLFFREPYASRIPGLFNGSFTGDEINQQLTDTVARLVTENLKNHFTDGAEFAGLRNELDKNSMYGWRTEMPVRFYHGTSDDNVYYGQSVFMHEDMLRQGSYEENISLYLLDGLNHQTALVPWGVTTIKWFLSVSAP